MTEIPMPRLSDSMEEGTILSWLKDDGDEVAVGDELVEIETDKATMTYESPAEGSLRIVAGVGETLPVGAPIAQLGAGAPAATATTSEQPVETPEPAPAAVSTNGNGLDPEVRATPLARRMATVHGVDLAVLEGTGPRGRITRADVAASAGIGDPVHTSPPPSGHDPEIRPAFRDKSPTDAPPTQDLTRVQQLIARRMSEAKATIPEFQVQTEADIDRLMATAGDALHLLLDTGHATWAGADPARLARHYKARISHVHTKDVREVVMLESNRNDWSFLDSVLAGVYTVPGDGLIDYGRIFRELKGYSGWVVVEAEQDPEKANPAKYAKLGYANLSRMLKEAGLLS